MATASPAAQTLPATTSPGDDAWPAIVAEGLTRRYGAITALDDFDLSVEGGRIHAILGPNGAGKTTLLRLLTGLVQHDGGWLRVLGERPRPGSVGWVPSGDRSFYLRLSGHENLLFFGRLYGLRRRAARERAETLLEQVGLAHAARRPVSTYSHGMQKRLLLARALLSEPTVLLVDEATHDLDPEAAERVRALVRSCADRGAAVLWATQRIDEIRGFAETVTFLAGGRVRFEGTVDGLLAHAPRRRYVLRVDGRSADALATAVAELAELHTVDAAHVLLALAPGAGLGAAVAAMEAAGATIRDCRQERSEGEAAFFALLEDAA
jgi:ABC-2 type transport system ATP-binding protein